MVSINKFDWQDENIPVLDPHSQVKHKVLSEYLDAYVATLMSNANIEKLSLTLVDGFCGGGIFVDNDNNQVDGSPLIMIKSIAEARVKLNLTRFKPRIVDVDYYFIDKSTNAIQMLSNVLKINFKDNSFYSDDLNKSRVINGGFTKFLPQIVESIKLKKGGEKAIFFLDQYGYSQVTMETIRYILTTVKKSEIILTFNISSILPFFSNNKDFRKAFVNLGIDHEIDWTVLNRIPKNNHTFREFIQRSIAGAIKKCSGAAFMTPFFIKPLSDKEWGYWLVHLTNEYRAHEVMKRVHWDNATHFGHEIEPGIFEFSYEAKKDKNLEGITDFFDFGESAAKRCIDTLQEEFGILVFNQNEPIQIGKFFESVVSQTPAAEYHLQTAMKQLHQDNSVEILNVEGKTRSPSKKYHKSDLMIASRQYKLKF